MNLHGPILQTVLEVLAPVGFGLAAALAVAVAVKMFAGGSAVWRPWRPVPDSDVDGTRRGVVVPAGDDVTPAHEYASPAGEYDVVVAEATGSKPPSGCYHM